MLVTIQKWGNSCAVRLPKKILDSVGLEENTSVDLEACNENDSIIIKRANPKFRHKTITERLESYYGKPIEEIEPSREEEINWGGRVGDELL